MPLPYDGGGEHSRAPRILIVDDDLAILDALELALLDACYEVQTASKNGEYIKQKLRAGLPNLIILDVLLSGHDGREICRTLKADPHTRHIPVIMISAHPTARDTVFEAGSDDFLAKPFDIDDLLTRLQRFI